MRRVLCAIDSIAGLRPQTCAVCVSGAALPAAVLMPLIAGLRTQVRKMHFSELTANTAKSTGLTQKLISEQSEQKVIDRLSVIEVAVPQCSFVPESNLA